jgi:hypothetical protein
VVDPDTEEIAGRWGKLHNGKQYCLCSSTCMIKVIRSRVMNWTGSGGPKGPKRNAHTRSAGYPERKITHR